MSPQPAREPIRGAQGKGFLSLALPALVAIDHVEPQVDDGRFPIKRIVGESVEVRANIYSGGHDLLNAVLRFRPGRESNWTESFMTPLGNDRWSGTFAVRSLGRYVYTLQAWIDHFASWRRDVMKKVQAGQQVGVDLLVGVELIQGAAERATGEVADRLRTWAVALGSFSHNDVPKALQLIQDNTMAVLAAHYPDRSAATIYEKELEVVVDREKARHSTWYEMFPRSAAATAGQHGTFKDCEARIPYVAGMGFDVLYLPPIHPIGQSYRKGKNNKAEGTPQDVGSPWAIGSREGGHKAVHPQLGTLDDFRSLITKAQEQNIEIALDLAFQCSPDHPYVQEHPEWFRWRPDGTVQSAENPPKKYQDIYPIEFENDDWRGLWEELKSIVIFWAEQGVRIFRVDNPHTKPFAFWEWLIAEVKAQYPDVLFLAEAFTRPNVMHRLAKLGFTQSYTYFTWRNTKQELVQYFAELAQPAVREYFRPNLWPNTPDILGEYLQVGGQPAFMVRLVLAATLGANYGIYGPAFELGENRPYAAGSEEYLNSEKYEVRFWDVARASSLSGLIERVNAVRRANPALQSDANLRFHPVDNEQLIAFTKADDDLSNVVLVVVNLDFRHPQSGWLELPLAELGLDPHRLFQVHDQLTDTRYLWSGSRNYVELAPSPIPAHVFVMRRWVRTERDFDYYL